MFKKKNRDLNQWGSHKSHFTLGFWTVEPWSRPAAVWHWTEHINAANRRPLFNLHGADWVGYMCNNRWENGLGSSSQDFFSVSVRHGPPISTCAACLEPMWTLAVYEPWCINRWHEIVSFISLHLHIGCLPTADDLITPQLSVRPSIRHTRCSSSGSLECWNLSQWSKTQTINCTGIFTHF